MGCCLTTNHRRHNPPPQKPKTSPPTPPAFEEKETVKEVLSETPLPPPPPETEETKATNNVVVLTKNNPTTEIQENVSDVSEMFSYSESYSAATTATVADTKKEEDEEEEEDGEVTQKIKNTKSPPLPAKRVVRKRPVGERTTTRAPVRRQMAASPEKKRRDVAVRRSRSPAVRGEMGQRKKVVRGKSPVERSGEVVPVKEAADDGGGTTELEVSESLENPLVSLECFIFL